MISTALEVSLEVSPQTFTFPQTVGGSPVFFTTMAGGSAPLLQQQQPHNSIQQQIQPQPTTYTLTTPISSTNNGTTISNAPTGLFTHYSENT